MKGTSPRDLIVEHAGRLQGAVLLGTDSSELQRLFSELLPELPVRVVSGESVMEKAVEQAVSLASPGDVVLLAPAAASMDQFKDYADRGNQFISAVGGLK